MHRLHLLRHAKSDRDGGVEDHERRLSRRGREAARLIGLSLPAALGPLDLVLCSTALRTRETASLALTAYTPPPRIVYEEALYLATAAALLRRLRAIDERDEAVLIVGHNPGLAELALMLAAPGSLHHRRLADSKFPTAARASFRVEGPWASLDRCEHLLTDYVTAKSLGTAG